MHSAHVAYICDGVGAATPIAEVTPDLIDSWTVRELRGRRRDGEGQRVPISPRTLQKRVCTLSLALQAAQRRGWIAELPRLPRLRARYSPRRNHLRNFGELVELSQSLPIDRADWVWGAVFTGLRPANLHQLRAYVDCDPFGRRPWVVLRSQKTHDQDGVVVQMPTPLARRLRARFERRQLRTGDLVLDHWDKDARSKALRSRGYRASDFRRTCGSWAAHGLGTLTVSLMQWLRHSDFSMLSRVYARALGPGFADVSRALGAMARAPRRGPKAFASRNSSSAAIRRPEKKSGR